MASLCKEEGEPDEEERDLFEALHDIVAHTLYVNKDKTTSEAEQETFSHMVIVHDTTDFASFTADLQNIAVEHVVTADKHQRFGNVFRGIIVDNGTANGTTARRLQYQAY